MQKAKSAQAVLLLCCGWSSFSFASDFYTIIGPDGRPMIIQQNATSVKPKPEKVKAPVQPQKVESQSSDHTAMDNATQFKGAHFPENDTKATPNAPDSTQLNLQNQKNQLQVERLLEQKQHLAKPTPTQHVSKDQVLLNPIKDSQKPKNAKSNTKNSIIETKQASKSEGLVSVPESVSIAKPVDVSPSQKPKNDDSKFTEIDGVQYVDNEYLEDKEFNLEGKKRFYIMSEAGVAGGRQFETVEREKGISKSVFSKFLKNDNAVHGPIVLSSTYFRLPKQQVVENLQQSCFTGKKIEKAKFLSVDKDEMGFWPVAPIKENFAYEVVKLDKQVENIQLSSYASSQKNPSYYWPLVVFLDQQGCVIEGVTGFKSEDVDANHRQFASLVGILKKPSHAHFLFMTPLAESVDVDNLKLSNTGQIKLNVLR